jgi:hypothetical protein
MARHRAGAWRDLASVTLKRARVGDATRTRGIPDDMSMDGDEVFDPVKMGRLYDIGYRMAVGGKPWAMVPPGRQPDPAP